MSKKGNKFKSHKKTNIILSSVFAFIGFILSELSQALTITPYRIEITSAIALLLLSSIILFAILREDTKKMNHSTTESIARIANWVEMKVNYAAFDQDRHDQAAHNVIEEALESATGEILILDYNPIDESSNELKYTPRDRDSSVRQAYYNRIENKIKNGQGCRYVRIVQLPKFKQLSDILCEDKIFKNHCNTIIPMSTNQPEQVCLKTCELIYHGNLFLIDRRLLVLQINLIDFKSYKFSKGGFLLIEGENTEIVKYFSRLFSRLETISELQREAF